MRSRTVRTRLSKRQSELMKRPVFDDKSFDFDIGYLVKSPCRECIDRYLFPECMDSCLSLDKIRTVLANSISCSRSHASLESCAIFQESREDK